jgi:hypothetical protein
LKKLIPIVITVILISYLAIYLWLPLSIFDKAEPFAVKVFISALGAGAAGMIAAVIYTLIIRLKEIDKEDKDDLSKY